MDLEIIDNFLPKYQFNLLQSALVSDEFPWFFNDGIYRIPEPRRFQFTHNFYMMHGRVLPTLQREGETVGPHFHLLDNLLSVLGKRVPIAQLLRIKGNLNPRTFFHNHGGYHVDCPDVRTALFYLTTCNGYTRFKKSGRKIKSVANRLVLFDSNLEHEGVTCTDKKIKVVLNINFLSYIENAS